MAEDTRRVADYSPEEICEGCVHAVWHDCVICKRHTFCFCLKDSDGWQDGMTMDCPEKEVQNE